jgi:hypothetical protein
MKIESFFKFHNLNKWTNDEFDLDQLKKFSTNENLNKQNNI